jgi:hypothetical protein
MNQKTGLTTGSLSGDLDAKFGQNERKISSFFVMFALFWQNFALIAGLLLAIPLIFAAGSFLITHPNFLHEQVSRFLALFS